MSTKPASHPFLSPGEEIAYASQKISRRITDTSSGESLLLDSIMSRLDDEDELDKRENDRLAKIMDMRQLQTEIEKAKSEKEKKKNLSRPVKIYSIQSLDEDGMSWSSQMVYDCVQTHNAALQSSAFNISCFQPAFNSTTFPSVASVIGEKRFMGLLYQAGILKRTWLGKNARLWLRSVWAVAFGVLGNYIFEAIKGSEDTGLKDLGIYRVLVIAAVTLIGSGINLLLEKYVTVDPVNDADKKRSAPLNEYFASDPFDTKLLDLVKLAAVELHKLPAPRFFIIDNYELLDVFTRNVLDQYLLHYPAGNAVGKKNECWVIFQPQQGEQFLRRNQLDPLKINKKIITTDFELELLTKAEKKALIAQKKLNDVERRLNRTTVKAVCREMSGYKWIAEKMKAYKSDHEDDFQARFITLLALTCNPHNVEFNLREIKEVFSKEKVKQSVLQFYLFGKKEETWTEDYARLMDTLANSNYWGKMMQVKKTGKRKSWQVIAEVSEVLNDLHELDKLRHGGHIFWALYWYNRMPAKTIQSVWIKKLSYHLCELELSGIYAYENMQGKLVSKDRIYEQMFEAYLFAVDGCVRTCLLKYKASDLYNESSGVVRLLNKAFNVALGSQLSEKKPLLNRLLAKVWELYFITFEEELFELVEKINEELENSQKHEGVSPLENLFYQALPIQQGIRRDLVALPADKELEEERYYEVLKEFALARAYWLSLLIEPLLVHVTVEDFQEARSHGAEIWGDNLDKVQQRIGQATSARECIIDLMNLSYHLWSFTVYYDAVGECEELDIKFASNVRSALDALTAPQLTSQLSREGEYFINSQLVETCIFSYCSLVAYLYSNKGKISALTPEQNATLLENLKAIVERLELFLDTQLVSLKAIEDVFDDKQIEKIDSLLELSCIIWKRLQLDEMYSMVTVRRIHFNTICSANKNNKQFYLSSIVGSTVSESIHSRFLINLAKVVYKRDSIELRFKFIANTGRLIKSDGYTFGSMVKEHIFKVAFLYSSSINRGVDDFYTEMIGGDAERSGLHRFLQASVPEKLDSVINKIFTSRHYIKDSLRQYELDKIVDLFISRITDPSVRKTVSDQVKYHRFNIKVAESRKLDTAHELAQWHDHEATWYYPAILTECIRYGSPTPELEANCVKMFSHAPNEDAFTSNMNLSITFLEQSLLKPGIFSTASVDAAKSYLLAAINKFTTVSSADANIRAYELLEKLDSINSDIYNVKKNEWAEYNREIESLEVVIEHLTERRFCVLFLRIADQLNLYGLNLAEIDNEPGTIPAVFFRIENLLYVNNKFLKLCRAVIDNKADSQIQELANEISRASLRDLIDTGFDLPDLPKQMKAILNEYRDQIDDFIISTEKEEV